MSPSAKDLLRILLKTSGVALREALGIHVTRIEVETNGVRCKAIFYFSSNHHSEVTGLSFTTRNERAIVANMIVNHACNGNMNAGEIVNFLGRHLDDPKDRNKTFRFKVKGDPEVI